MTDDRPRKIYLEITTRCNLACRMCIRQTWHERESSMTDETFDHLLGQIRSVPSVSTLHFGGFGEPMTHPRLFTYLEKAKRAGLRTELITNGLLLTREAAEALAEVALDKIVVSLDGAGLAQDDALHPSPVVQVQEALRELYRIRLRQPRWAVEVGIAFVASRRNIRDLPRLKRLAPLLGFTNIMVSNLIPVTPEMADQTFYQRWSTARSNVSPSAWNPVIDLPAMDVRSEAAEVIEELCFTGSRVRLLGNELAGRGMRCRFVDEGCLAVTWDGSVSPCLPLLHTHTYYYHGQVRRIEAYRIGNLRVAPLDTLWESEAYRAFRERVRRFEFSPCIDCGGCDLRESNQEDCFGGPPPRCGACLWAAGLVQCP